eukprot:571808-Prorocentrum_minimum.AAC.2
MRRPAVERGAAEGRRRRGGAFDWWPTVGQRSTVNDGAEGAAVLADGVPRAAALRHGPHAEHHAHRHHRLARLGHGRARQDAQAQHPEGAPEAGGGRQKGERPCEAQVSSAPAALRAASDDVEGVEAAAVVGTMLTGASFLAPLRRRRALSPICRNSKRRRYSKTFVFQHFYGEFSGSRSS